jgi:capsid assembly protease
MRNPALFSRIFNTPLMIQPSKLDAIIAGIGGRFGLDAPMPEMALTATGEHKQPGYQVIGVVAVIDIFGVLVHRGGMDANSSYILGYDRIGTAFIAALNDTTVKSILLQIDSPGGEVAGAFELAAMIKQARSTKPVNAVISSMAASAGYLIASAASDIAISLTGVAGSVGVFLRHVDVSQMAETEGFKVTYVFAGGHKIDGNPYQPLPDAVKGDLQTEINKLYGLFVSTVADNRGLKPETVKAQEAAVFTGQDAIKAGIADRLATPDEILAEMQRGVFKSANTLNPAALAYQAELEIVSGWEKAIESVVNPTRPKIADVKIMGSEEAAPKPQAANSHTSTAGEGQAAAAGWDKATEDATAWMRERKAAQAGHTNTPTSNHRQDETADGWDKAIAGIR